MSEFTVAPISSQTPRYPGADEPPTLDTWQESPHSRWAFAHVSEFVPTTMIRRRAVDRGGIDATEAMRMPGLRGRLEESYTDAFIVRRGGRIVAEYYRPGFAAEDRHLLMSVSKSICGIVCGALIDDGLLDPSAPVREYVPPLDESAYGDATVQQVLDMTVAVDYDENYRDPASHVQAQDRVAGWRNRLEGDPADTYELLRGLHASGPHGQRFQYCSADTDVLAWVVESITGRRYADTVAERLWQRLGCDDDASITVDPAGFPFANGGISCTARDLARVGELMLAGGSVEGSRVVSADWVAQTLAGGDRRAVRDLIIQEVHPNVSYRNQWWSTGNERGNVYAVGIHGQYIWLDPPTDTVIVKLSSCPEPVTAAWNVVHAELFRDICDAL